jgi:predicted dehydrogenase
MKAGLRLGETHSGEDMNKVRFGVIGAGGIADRRAIPALLEAPSCELAAVMDVINADVLGRKYGVRFYDREDGLLADPGVDAVYIATPVHLHLRQTKQAAAAGKNILVEKPISMTSKEAEEAVAACEKAGVLLQVGYMMRFHVAHCRIKEIIASGAIGKPVYARAQLACWYPPIRDAWRQRRDSGGGGALMDMATHLYDLLEMFLGNIVKVAALTGRQIHDYEVEDSAVTLLQFDSGCQASVDTFFCIPDEASRTRLEIYGSRGAILSEGTIGQGYGGQLEVYREQGCKGYEAGQNKDFRSGFLEEPFEQANPYTREFESFARAILRGEKQPAINSGKQSAHILRVVEMAYESSKAGMIMTSATAPGE